MLLRTVRLHQLTSKKYKDMKSLVNMILDYVIEKRMIGVNVARNVHGIFIGSLPNLIKGMRPNRYMWMMRENGCSYRQIGTAQKGNHSIRKTCVSNMIDSKQLTNEEIRKFAGHGDFATTERHYEFATKIDGRTYGCI